MTDPAPIDITYDEATKTWHRSDVPDKAFPTEMACRAYA